MKIGIIDLGSNTIHLSIYHYEGINFHLLSKKKVMAGITSYVDNGKLSQEGLDKICNILLSYKKLLENFKVDEVRCFSTAALRIVDDKEMVLASIKKRTGIDIDIISGQKEAELDFIASKLSLDVREGIVIDIGGGSTELVSFKDDKIIDSFSLPIGSLVLYDRHVKDIIATAEEMSNISSDVLAELEHIKDSSIINGNFKKAIGVGGTNRAALRLINDIKKRKAKSFITKELIDLLEYLNSNDGVRKIMKVCPNRIHTIIPGAILLSNVLNKTNIDEVILSKYGVREGYLYSEVLLKAYRS